MNLVMASPARRSVSTYPTSQRASCSRQSNTLFQAEGWRSGEGLSDALNVIMATDSPLDIHGYRQPRKLIDIGRLEPVHSRRETGSGAFHWVPGLWDWVCDNYRSRFHVIQRRDATKVLKDAVLKMDDEQRKIRDHVASVLRDDRYDSNTPWIERQGYRCSMR